ncbi:AEC family transporter [Crenobacter cavernae]|nr:AEC family transporter [Crenobacter cavernae]
MPAFPNHPSRMLARILTIILPVLAIVLIGWLYSRKTKPDLTAMNRLNMQVCVPLLVFSVLAARDFDLASQWRLLPAALGVILLSGLIAWPVALAFKVSPRTLLPPMMFNNNGNMGLPLALLAFGRDGFHAFVVPFALSNLLHFTLGAYFFSRNTRLKHVATNPIVIASALGVACGLSKFALPDSLMLAVKMLGDVSIPLMLFALGARMVDVSFAGWKVGLLGAVLCPLTGLAASWLMVAWLDLTPLQASLMYLFGALPPAVLNFLMAEHYRQEPDRMASIVLIGNLASLMFVPMGLWIALR